MRRDFVSLYYCDVSWAVFVHETPRGMHLFRCELVCLKSSVSAWTSHLFFRRVHRSVYLPPFHDHLRLSVTVVLCSLLPCMDQVVNRTSVKLTLSSVASEWAAEDKLGPLSVTVRVRPHLRLGASNIQSWAHRSARLSPACGRGVSTDF